MRPLRAQQKEEDKADPKVEPALVQEPERDNDYVAGDANGADVSGIVDF